MFKIYGKEGCSFCDKAETLLIENGLNYVVLDAREHIATDQFLKRLKESDSLLKSVLGGITVPIITHTKDGVESYIGGYLELLDFKIVDL